MDWHYKRRKTTKGNLVLIIFLYQCIKIIMIPHDAMLFLSYAFHYNYKVCQFRLIDWGCFHVLVAKYGQKLSVLT